MMAKAQQIILVFQKKIDVYISSLSKGLGSFGGYVSAKKNIIELCINKSKSFIYTSALPRLLIDDATKRFESNRERNRKKLWRNVKKFSDGLKKIGFNNNSKGLHSAKPNNSISSKEFSNALHNREGIL